MEQFLEMAEWQQCTAVLYECAVAADSRLILSAVFMWSLVVSVSPLRYDKSSHKQKIIKQNI